MTEQNASAGGDGLRLTEFDSPNKTNGRRGHVPDMVVFGFTHESVTETHEKYLDAATGMSSHYLIAKNGDVYQYVNITDSAAGFMTSVRAGDDNYYQKAPGGLIACRAYCASLYTISVMFEGDTATYHQTLAASALLRLLGLKLIRIYRKKLPTDESHIVTSEALPCGSRADIPLSEIITYSKTRQTANTVYP